MTGQEAIRRLHDREGAAVPRIKLSRRNVFLFAACWLVFWILGGFSWPENTLGATQSAHDSAVSEAWSYCIYLYLAGAVSLSLVEHKIGEIEPVSIRVVYALAGAGLMAGGLLWWYAAKSAF